MNTEKIVELLGWALTNYGFVAKGKGRITGKQLASLIDENFVCEPYENYLNNIEESKNLTAKEIIEKCVGYVLVRHDGETTCTFGYGNVTHNDIINWGLV